MSNRRNILVEIEGCPIAFCDPEIATAPVQWGQTVYRAIIGVPNSQAMAVDPFDGSWRSSGMTVRLNKEAGILLSRLSTPETYLTADVSASATTINVGDTALFPSSGTIWIGSEARSYSGKTATTFTGCTPASLGTAATTHSKDVGPTGDERTVVHGYNPFIHGREIYVWRYDPDDPVGTKQRRFCGYVDDFAFDASGFSIPCINANKRLQDAQIMSGTFARGVLLTELDAGARKYNYADVRLEDGDVGFPDPSPSSGVRIPRYFQAGREIIQYLIVDSPAVSASAASTSDILGSYTATGPSSDSAGYYFEPDYPTTSSLDRFQIGDEIQFTDSATSAVVKARITLVDAYKVYHNLSGYNPAGAGTVTSVGREILSLLLRPSIDTSLAAHNAGDEIKEVRVVEGNHVDVLLQLLTSIDGDGSNGAWDVLPTGWGAGLPVGLFDTAALLALKDYATDRRYVFDRTESAVVMLRNLARITGARIFWDETGKLTAKSERDVYPDSAIGLNSITASQDMMSGEIPRWSGPTKDFRNAWVLRGNAPASENSYLDEAYFDIEESVRRHGKRELAPYEDRGLILGRSLGTLEPLAVAVLRRWSDHNPWIESTIELLEEIWRQPGDLIPVTVPHLPNLDGTAGLTSALFELLEFTPNDIGVSARIRMAQMPNTAETRLVAPCGTVQSVASSVLTLKAASATYHAPTTDKTDLGILEGGDGTEDVDWFRTGDDIAIFDVSDFGASSPNVHRTTISAINFATREITLSTTPGTWTIAAEDEVRLGAYATVAAGLTSLYRVPWFMCMADSSNIPRTLGSDAPHVWGL